MKKDLVSRLPAAVLSDLKRNWIPKHSPGEAYVAGGTTTIYSKGTKEAHNIWEIRSLEDDARDCASRLDNPVLFKASSRVSAKGDYSLKIKKIPYYI